jgi:high-affinity iron transporter
MSFRSPPPAVRIASWAAVTLVIGVLVSSCAASVDAGTATPDQTAVVLEISVLVFREGLECILVLAAITASMVGPSRRYQRPIAVGAGIAFVATLLTWRFAIHIVDDLTQNMPALDVQAITGLLAVIVLIVVMNWFFHKMYWTGWISLHNRKKQELLQNAHRASSKARVMWGLGLLGFTSLYREGFEVVLLLQSYRLKLGGNPVFQGVLLGLLFSGIVAVLTFVAHRRLPYRRMLVLTGVLLGVVLLVMVGEQTQEMQLAHWLPTTEIPWLSNVVPSWMGLWFSVFPTVETLCAQAIAVLLVLGSYIAARLRLVPYVHDDGAKNAA